MKKKSTSKSAFFNLRTLAGLVLCLFGVVLSMFAAGVLPTGAVQVSQTGPTQIPGATSEFEQTPNGPAYVHRDFQESALIKGGSFKGDLRNLPFVPAVKVERPELEQPQPNPRLFVPTGGTSSTSTATTTSSATSNVSARPSRPSPAAPAPTPSIQFDGLDFATWGAGHPPDENGDVGPTYYIQTVNTSIGIYLKSTGFRTAAFTFNTFFAGHFGGNLCETNNFGDPVVVYDSFEDRWVITDFAFTTDVNGNVTSNIFQCFAVSQSGDPVSGGWNFYSTIISDNFPDYPKFGIWPDALYWSANMFGPGVNGTAGQGVRVWALNKAQMYAGAPTVQIVVFTPADTTEFTLIPSNARLQTGSPPAGTPNYFVSTWEFLNAQEVYKFHVDWTNISLTTFTGPFVPLAASSWPNAAPANAAELNGNALDPLVIRNMFSTMYSNISGVESLWASHTVERGTTTTTGGFATPRWYQIPVTGGTVGANDTQGISWDPDGANTNYRYCPSLAVDRAGDLAMGYTVSNSSTNPSIRYAGRLAGDAVNTFSQTETTMITGTGSQTGNCGTTTCIRWGDYSRMALDPDGCTFWYTNEYYAVNGLNDLTRIGAFKYTTCTTVGSGGTVSGTVTDAGNSNPLSGATVMLGAGRTMSTNGSGNYSFTSIPAGTYTAGMSASFPGYTTGTVSSKTVTDGGTTTQNFALTAAATSGCPADNSTATFQMGTPTNTDLTASPNNVVLLQNTFTLDQQNTTVLSSGFGFNSTSWAAQTFTPAISGPLTKADLDLFCSTCTTGPNLTLSVRLTSGGLPTGGDLATATITGTSSGSGGYLPGTFGSPVTLNAGTQYALVIRPQSNPAGGTYAYVVSNTSGSNPYSGGRVSTSANSGGSWSLAATNQSMGFHTYMNTGYATSGNFVSSAKDANPAAGWYPTWGNITFTDSIPANTTITFQAAASNNPAGVFNFVGPFSSGASLAQFNGMRYLRWKASLTTSNTAVTPSVSSVTTCFTDLAPPVLQSVVSRFTHGNGAGTFDLPLSTSSRVVEPRTDFSGNYTIIYTFDKPVNAGSASVTAHNPGGGAGSVSGTSFSGNSMIVSLTGVTDQQTVTLSGSNVTGTDHTQAFTVPAVQIGFLIGDVTGDGVVNVGDTTVVRNNAGADLDNTNFQDDVNTDGAINVGDTTIVRNNSGNFLP